jgi:2-(1,2-epoxy-1,2-dihydrophenyl)acetyl-CoA isomerase
MSAGALTAFAAENGVGSITLDRADRHNSLVPALLDSLIGDVAAAARADIGALVLRANGRSFSTGGDVAAFFDVAPAERGAYGGRIVGALNRAILSLLDLPFPVIGRVHGPVTGGSLGLVLACDLVAVTPAAFFQPYYVDVGFSPDGGWTALLPDRIGEAKARMVQLLNRRISAAEAVDWGIASALVPAADLDATISDWLETLGGKVAGAVGATKARLMPPERRAAYAAGLEAERASFVAQIATAAAHEGMARFLRRSA